MIDSWNVYRLVALLDVFLSAIELGPFVAIVSIFFNVFKHKWLNLKLVRVILIALMAVKDVKTQFASAM